MYAVRDGVGIIAMYMGLILFVRVCGSSCPSPYQKFSRTFLYIVEGDIPVACV